MPQVISYEDGRIYCASSSSLLDIRRQLHLQDNQQKLALIDHKRNIFLEVRSKEESSPELLSSFLLDHVNNVNTAISSTSSSIEVSPRNFYIPSEEYAFAGLTNAQRVFGCGATSVRLLTRQQHGLMYDAFLSRTSSSSSSSASPTKKDIRPTATLPRFLVCSKIENWTGKKSLSNRLFSSSNSSTSSSTTSSDQQVDDDINFATAVLNELALLISARGSNNIIQLKSIYFAPNDKEQRDVYVVCEEGPTEVTSDIATFAAKILPNLHEVEQEELNDQQQEKEKPNTSSAESVSLAFEACRQLLDGVAHLHELGVVHGGITPRNMLASKINHHLQNYPAHSYWKFYLRDLGLIEAAACRYRSKDQLCFRKFVSEVASSSNGNKKPQQGDIVDFYSESKNPFYNPENISDEILTMTYAAPESLVGAPPTNATDIWSCGLILSEILGSVFSTKPFPKNQKFDPIIEECGRGGTLNSHMMKKGVDPQELWERITDGSGFPVSWKEARNRYAQTVRAPFSNKRLDYYSGEGKKNSTNLLVKSISATNREEEKEEEQESTKDRVCYWSKSRTLDKDGDKDATTNSLQRNTLNTDIAIARVLSATPGNPWKHQSPSRAASFVHDQKLLDYAQPSTHRHHQQPLNNDNNNDNNSSSRPKSYQEQKEQEDNETVLSLARAYATAEGVTSPQRKYTSSSAPSPSVASRCYHSVSSSSSMISPLVGDFATYLARRNVPEQVGQALLHMMHFYPERRPTAVRCRMNPAFYKSSSTNNNNNCQTSTNPSATSASVRLHFAQKVDQSELHRKILAVIESVAKREVAVVQSNKLMDLAWLLDGLIKRGSIKNNFGRILEEILMSKAGIRKVEDDMVQASHAENKGTEEDEEAKMERKLKRLLGHTGNATTDVFSKSPSAIFTADSIFTSMATLQLMMKILVCLANARDMK